MFLVLLNFLVVIFIFFTNNMVFWWSLYLLMTIIFMYLMISNGSGVELVNYFLIQEFMGFMFLIFMMDFYQCLFIIVKSGVSPFHFWVFSVIGNCNGYLLMWFLTFQKMPYLVTIIYFYSMYFLLLILFGILVCMFQVFMIKNFKFLSLLNSTDSFSWIILSIYFCFFEFYFIYFMYIFSTLFLFPYFVNTGGQLSWELLLFFFNVPFSLNFFIKIFVLVSFYNFSLFILFLLLVMFFSVLGYSIFMFSQSLNIMNNNNNMYMLIFYIMFSLIFLF